MKISKKNHIRNSLLFIGTCVLTVAVGGAVLFTRKARASEPKIARLITFLDQGKPAGYFDSVDDSAIFCYVDGEKARCLQIPSDVPLPNVLRKLALEIKEAEKAHKAAQTPAPVGRVK